MKLSSPKIKKFLYFRKWNFLAPASKLFLKEKLFLHFRKWNFLALRLKTLLYFLKKIVFLIFKEMELPSPKIKKFQEGNFRAQKLKT